MRHDSIAAAAAAAAADDDTWNCILLTTVMGRSLISGSAPGVALLRCERTGMLRVNSSARYRACVVVVVRHYHSCWSRSTGKQTTGGLLYQQ